MKVPKQQCGQEMEKHRQGWLIEGQFMFTHKQMLSGRADDEGRVHIGQLHGRGSFVGRSCLPLLLLIAT